MTPLRISAIVAVLSLAGCAGNELITGTGQAALDPHVARGMTPAQAAIMAQRAATLVAQRDLIERYAGSFLSSQTQIKDFVAESDRILSKTGGLIKGARVVRVELAPDQSAYLVVVQAREKNLRETLGAGPHPNIAVQKSIAWPDEFGGVSTAMNEPLRVSPRLETVTAKGVGLIPYGLDPLVARLQAKRSAKIDALRNLAEKVKGIRLNSTTTVRDFVAERDEISTQVDAVITGADVVTERENADGTVEVEVAVRIPQIRNALGIE